MDLQVIDKIQIITHRYPLFALRVFMLPNEPRSLNSIESYNKNNEDEVHDQDISECEKEIVIGPN